MRDGGFHVDKGTSRVQDSVMIDVESSAEIMNAWQRKVFEKGKAELVMFLPECGNPNF